MSYGGTHATGLTVEIQAVKVVCLFVITDALEEEPSRYYS
jgi:hypothetical protein